MTKATRGVSGIRDVAERQLCTGCGVCAFVQPDDIVMVDDLDAGRRPLVRQVDGVDVETGDALATCPGVSLERGELPVGVEKDLLEAWGPVLEMWEGYAADPEIRFAGSSGGAATALALFSVEREGAHGVLHAAARDDVAYLNHTVMSRTRGELLARTGSRYSPASPCDGLERIADAPTPCVFIGKPCDVAAVSRVRGGDARLDANISATIAIFCAGTPSTRGTLELIATMGIEDPATVSSVRYRGNGWPGDAVVTADEGTSTRTERMSYAESWGGVLQKHRQWRCYVCVDHTGEFADVAVGDPWYRTIEPGDAGRSLVVVRTERGRALVRGAIGAGYLQVEPAAKRTLPASQPNLLEVRGAVWGRVVTCRLMGVAAPVLVGLRTFPIWLRDLTFRQKLQSIVGMARRVHRKGLDRRRPVVAAVSTTLPRPVSRASTEHEGG